MLTTYHVFAHHKCETLWFHHFSAETFDDAREEVESLYNRGYVPKIIKSARDPMDLLMQLRNTPKG